MERKKIIILAAGFVILVILSVIMFILESDGQPGNTAPGEETSVQQNEPEAGNVSENTDIQSTNEELEEAEASLSENEEELRSQAQEAINSVSLSEDAGELSYDALFEHALLHQYYNFMDEETVLEEENLEKDAEWIAAELNMWYDYSSENYGFEYNEAEFEAFINDSEELSEDTHTRILLEELSDINKNLYYRQLDIHFSKQYIWHSIREDYAEDEGANLSDNAEDNQLFYSFEQKVMERVLEENPQLLEEN